MPSTDTKPPSPSILRRPGFWITLLTVVPLLIGIAYFLENWMGARELARLKAEVAAAGIELDPHRIPSIRPPDADNFCTTPLLLALGNGVTSGAEYQSIERIARWRNDSYGKSTPKLDRPELQSPTHPEPTDWALIRDALALNDPTLGLASGGPEPLPELAAVLDRELASVMADLEAALPRPRSVFVPTFLDRLRRGEEPFTITLELDGLRKLASVMHLRAHVDLATGRPDRAVLGIRLLLRLAEGVEAYENLVGALVGGSVREQALKTTWAAALSPRDIAKDRWLELAAAHRTGTSLDRIPIILRGDMIYAHEVVSDLHADRKRLCETLGSSAGLSPGPQWHQWLCEVIPPGWIDFNMARSLEGGLIMIQRFGDAEDPKRFNREKNMDWAREWLVPRSGMRHTLFADSIMSALVHGAAAYSRFPIISRLAEIACALEAFHADHKSYPAELTTLVPEFLSSVPVDIDGQPVRYALDPGNGRYRVWSIGEDGVDDGGVVKYVSPRKPKNPRPWSEPVGDWVWQYPPN